MKNLIILLTCISISMAVDGKIGGITYFDYTKIEDGSAFNLNRQYFSYAVDMSDDIKFKVIFDVGRSATDSRLNTYLKKAQVNYKTSYANISLGLIGTNTYGVQEKNWGYRFIEKSAIDLHKYSSTADIGIGFSRSLIDNLNMSLQVVNGEGFKQPQGDKYHKISFNTTYGERRLNKNDGYNTGIVYSTEATDSEPTNMISAFGGFAGMGLRLGAEYDLLTKGDTESSIISVNANYGIIDNIDAFVRYDIWDDNDSVIKNGKNYLIAGVLFNCDNGLSLAPNMRIESFENDSESKTEYKINFQFKF